ncbi:hypothetical protein QZH41_002883 [Actinostola sp. cb2023]|nr:hypothetical protein QZH41_002883 [Actinostola sp. cb2023]
MYEIKTEDFYKDIKDDIDRWFDTSAYPKDHPIGKWVNKKVIGMMKDETAAQGEITEFVGLRSKLYAYKIDEKEEKKCKGDAKPVKLPPRRTPPHQREVIDHQLDDLLAHGRIEPSQSPWSSPVVLVRKNDGSYRMCIDYRCHLKSIYIAYVWSSAGIVKRGLKLKPAKCQFLKQRVTFLGHVVSSQGIETDPEKTKAVVDWPVPVDVKELQRFLGLVGYYRRFVTEFSTTAEPLYRLCKKFTPFQWGSKEQMAFEELKKSLVSAPVLAYPNFSTDAGRFILDTDASQQLGIGAVLSQLQPDGTERVIRDLKIHWTATTRTAGSAVEAWVEITVTAREKQTISNRIYDK